MAKHIAQPHDAEAVETYLHETAGLKHLRTRRRADLVIIESGAEEDPWPHTRLRRVGVHRLAAGDVDPYRSLGAYAVRGATRRAPAHAHRDVRLDAGACGVSPLRTSDLVY